MNGERARAAADGLAAFATSDRRCRSGNPTASDLVARAAQLSAIGDVLAGKADLRAALELDPLHPEGNVLALEWLEGAERAAAASRLVASGRGASSDVRSALRVAFETQTGVIHRLRGAGADVRGWIAWAGEAALPLEFFDGKETWIAEAAPDRVHALAGEGYSVVDIVAEGVSAVLDARDGAPLFRRAELGEAPSRRVAAPPDAAPLTVIVPVYGDLQATQECLETLFSQRDIVFSVILVDDCSLDPKLGALVDAAGLRAGVTVIRNASNLGFARSVNRALRLSERDDVLMLNADVWLPPNAIARLRAVATSDPSIGTATPFSNNSQITSFPRPYCVNAMPAPEEAMAVDGIAAAVNGAGAVDVPTGIGFCLYISRACLDAVGELPEHYGRGYYEDVEFSLLARKRGFRNVCATGIFVGHHGSSSFRASKQELVARNLAILETRFPRHALEFAAFAVADPLRAARAAIELRIPPARECAIVVASEGRALWQARRRAEELEKTGFAAVLFIFAPGAAIVAAQRVEEGAPFSLRFSLEGQGLTALGEYLAQLPVKAIEVFDVANAPDALVDALFAIGAPVDLFSVDSWALRGTSATQTDCCESPTGGDPCRACIEDHSAAVESLSWREREARMARALASARAVRSLDRMGDAFARRLFGDRAGEMWEPAYEPASPPALHPSAWGRIGILTPIPSLESDRIAIRLARKLARADERKRIVVFGSSFLEESLLSTGAAWVSGLAKPDDYPALARQYGVARLALFDRSGLFGPLEAAARSVGLRKAYFDWSFGALAVEPGDLAIDPRVCDEKAASEVAMWLDSD